MLNGKYRGTDIGSGTDVWKFTDEFRAGEMSREEYEQAESGMTRSAGHCMTMGTASTMAKDGRVARYDPARRSGHTCT